MRVDRTDRRPADARGARPPRRRDRINRLLGVLDRIDHIGVAVQDLDAALELYRDRLGLSVAHRETVSEQGVEAVLLDVGENHV